MSAPNGARGRQSGRRVVLPGADELFRSTGDEPSARSRTAGRGSGDKASGKLTVVEAPESNDAGGAGLTSSRRERHDEKITVYISEDELLQLERARLALRADHGLAVDRGRVVREALTYMLDDLNRNGEASLLVRQLREG